MASTPIQPVNTAQNLNSVLQLIQGGTNLIKGSSSSTTTKSNISDAGVAQLLQQMLSGSQGLGTVTGAQRSAGLYNSTTNSMLVNDLLSRAAGETEVRRAGTTTTSRQNPQLGAADLLTMLGSAAAAKVLAPTLKKAGSKLGLDELGTKISDAVFGTSTATLGAAEGAGVSSIAAETIGGVSGAGSAAWDALAGSLLGDSLGTAFLGSSAAGVEALGAAWAPEALGLTGAIGAGTSAAEIAALGTSAAEIGGTVAAGTAAAEGAGILGSLGEAAVVLGWIICTELYRQGKMPRRFYVHGAKEFAKYPKNRIKGYYVWAIPCVQHLRKKPDSVFSKVLKKVFRSRAEYLAAIAGEKSARKTVVGFLTTHLLYGFCWTLSFAVPDSYTESWKGVIYG